MGQVWRCNDHAGRNPWSSYSAPGSGSVRSSVDSCYIHRGCVGGASYSFGTDKDGRPDSMGAGWYCNDGQYVDSSTQYDQCQIHKGCHSGVYYDETSGVEVQRLDGACCEPQLVQFNVLVIKPTWHGSPIIV